MNIATLNTSLRAAITGYAPINVWANDTYSKNHTFLARLDSRDTPDGTSCPYCALVVTGKQAGQDQRVNYTMFELYAVVTDTTASGLANLEQYRKHLEDAIVADIAGSIVLGDVDTLYDDQSSYPLMWCSSKLRFNDKITIGVNPLS